MSSLTVHRGGPVATLTLDRPQARNSLEPGLIGEITDAYRTLGGDAEVRVIVMTGAGSAFCAGADINWMREAAAQSEDESREGSAAAAAMFEAVDSCPKAVIGRVNGAAIGGGAGLVACTDVAIADCSAAFAFSEARLGVIAAVISPYVLRRIGPGPARALYTTARRFDAAEALRIGLVHEVVDADGLDGAVAAAVADVLACSPAAIAESKRLVRDATAGLRLPDLADRLAAARRSPDGQEGLAAFLEKRRPAWAPSEPSS